MSPASSTRSGCCSLMRFGLAERLLGKFVECGLYVMGNPKAADVESNGARGQDRQHRAAVENGKGLLFARLAFTACACDAFDDAHQQKHAEKIQNVADLNVAIFLEEPADGPVRHEGADHGKGIQDAYQRSRDDRPGSMLFGGVNGPAQRTVQQPQSQSLDGGVNKYKNC